MVRSKVIQIYIDSLAHVVDICHHDRWTVEGITSCITWSDLVQIRFQFWPWVWIDALKNLCHNVQDVVQLWGTHWEQDSSKCTALPPSRHYGHTNHPSSPNLNFPIPANQSMAMVECGKMMHHSTVWTWWRLRLALWDNSATAFGGCRQWRTTQLLPLKNPRCVCTGRVWYGVTRGVNRTPSHRDMLHLTK